MQIIQDSREQNPLTFSSVDGVSVVVETMMVGDYTARHKDGTMDSTVIERKSVADLFTSFSHGYENEKNKIERAKASGLTYVLAVESSAIDLLRGHSYWKDGEKRMAAKSGIAQIRQLMTLLRRGDLAQIWFCSSRMDMAFQIQEYFLTKERNDAP